MKVRSLWTGLSSAATILTVLVSGTNALAQTNAITTGNWSDGSTWSTAAEPTAGVTTNVGGGFTVTVNQAGENAGTLNVGPAGQTGNLSVAAPGALTLGPALNLNVGVGAGSNGTVDVTGGSVAVGDEIFIGSGNGSTGTVNVSGGSLATLGRTIIVGFDGGDATLNVSGTGSVTANFDMLVGRLGDGAAEVHLSDSGSITVGFLFTNSFTAPVGTVNMTQTGGTFNTRIAYVLGQAAGTTTLDHSGGTINAMLGNGDVVVSDGGGNTSTYNVSGTAVVNTLHNFFVGAANGSNGIVNQSGGTLNIGDNVFVGRDGDGAWNLSGGSIGADNVFLGDFDASNGTMEISGGTLNLSANLNVGAALASNGGQALDTHGTFIVSGPGGSINVGGNLLANPADNTRVDGPDNVGTLVFEATSSGLSIIDVAGIADLTGAEIDVDLLSSFSLGTTFDLITAADISADYLQVSEDVGRIALAIVAGGNGEILRATVVPEPTSVVMLVVGIAGLWGSRRQRGC